MCGRLVQRISGVAFVNSELIGNNYEIFAQIRPVVSDTVLYFVTTCEHFAAFCEVSHCECAHFDDSQECYRTKLVIKRDFSFFVRVLF